MSSGQCSPCGHGQQLWTPRPPPPMKVPTHHAALRCAHLFLNLQWAKKRLTQHEVLGTRSGRG